MKYIFTRGGWYSFLDLLMRTLHVTMGGYKSEFCLRDLRLDRVSGLGDMIFCTICIRRQTSPFRKMNG
jgi:hypothetical protein